MDTVDTFENYLLLLRAIFTMAIEDAREGKRSAKLFIRDCAPWVSSNGKLIRYISIDDVAKVRYRNRCN